VPLCAAEDLAERGRAWVFDVVLWRQPARAFVLRIDGRCVAYLNRCSHVPTEMDWQPGEFLDMRQALDPLRDARRQYEPADGAASAAPAAAAG
jgi:nitrite reductase/ring-hydroxylating ferredoxin subunit